MINWIPLGYAATMATIDALSFSVLKQISTKTWTMAAFPFAVLLYSLQPWIFMKSLNFETMTVMNVLWNLLSDVLVAFFGIVFLGESIGFRKAIGIVLSFLAMYFFSFEDGHSPFEQYIKGLFGFKSA